jgi:hypothetical protein
LGPDTVPWPSAAGWPLAEFPLSPEHAAASSAAAGRTENINRTKSFRRIRHLLVIEI